MADSSLTNVNSSLLSEVNKVSNIVKCQESQRVILHQFAERQLR